MKKLSAALATVAALSIVCLACVGFVGAYRAFSRESSVQTIQVSDIFIIKTPQGYYTVSGNDREIELNALTVTSGR